MFLPFLHLTRLCYFSISLWELKSASGFCATNESDYKEIAFKMAVTLSPLRVICGWFHDVGILCETCDMINFILQELGREVAVGTIYRESYSFYLGILRVCSNFYLLWDHFTLATKAYVSIKPTHITKIYHIVPSSGNKHLNLNRNRYLQFWNLRAYISLNIQRDGLELMWFKWVKAHL